MILRTPTEETTDPITGEIVQNNPIDQNVSGIIVPASAEDIQKGFQFGEYKGFFSLPVKPAVNLCKIIDGTDIYDIKGVEWWKDKGIYTLRLSK